MPRWHRGLALWLLLGVAACGRGNRDKTADTRALDVLPQKLDLGVLVKNEPVHTGIDLRNPGDAEIALRESTSSTRCRWQGIPGAIPARSTRHVSIVCQSDLLGPLTEFLTVLDTTGTTVLATLLLEGKVEPVVGFDTDYVDLRPGFGNTASVDVHLIGKQSARATPKVTSTGGDVVTAVALAPDRGHAGGFRLSCKGVRVGMHAGSIMVDTGVAAQPTLTLSWGCRVPATLEVEPASPYFNLRASGDRATQVMVRSTRPHFAVKSARVVEGPFRATVEKRAADGGTPITIRVRSRDIPAEARAVTGKLLIESNDEREPRKEVPLFGFGKVNQVPASK